MHVAILTFEGFNELDSLIAFGILNRVKEPGWRNVEPYLLTKSAAA